MKFVLPLLLVLGAVSLVGCSRNEEPEPPTPQTNVFSGQTQALEQAKDAGQAMENAAASEAEAIDRQSDDP